MAVFMGHGCVKFSMTRPLTILFLKFIIPFFISVKVAAGVPCTQIAITFYYLEFTRELTNIDDHDNLLKESIASLLS